MLVLFPSDDDKSSDVYGEWLVKFLADIIELFFFSFVCLLFPPVLSFKSLIVVVLDSNECVRKPIAGFKRQSKK